MPRVPQRRRRRPLLAPPSSQTGLADDGQRVDIMHYHIDTDTPTQERWGSAKEHYRDVMRYPDDINFITILRDPRDRLLSFYAFFVEFETGVREAGPLWHSGCSRSVCRSFPALQDSKHWGRFPL